MPFKLWAMVYRVVILFCGPCGRWEIAPFRSRGTHAFIAKIAAPLKSNVAPKSWRHRDLHGVIVWRHNWVISAKIILTIYYRGQPWACNYTGPSWLPGECQYPWLRHILKDLLPVISGLVNPPGKWNSLWHCKFHTLTLCKKQDILDLKSWEQIAWNCP